jgi:Mg-chelatase subunit ChlD
MRLLVIDTESRHLTSGLARELADRAGGSHHRLPRADPHVLSALTRQGLGRD